MADTMKIPGLGEQKKTTVYVIGGVVVLVMGIGYWRSRQAAATAPATSTDTSSTDTSGDGTDTTGNTSYDYSGAYDSGSYGDGSTDLYGTPLPDTSTQQPGGYTSNPQWSQAAEDYLANTVGLNSTSVQAALGKYLTGGSVDPTQSNIIEQAIAAEGYPPQQGPNGYPPSIKLAAAATPSVTLQTPVLKKSNYKRNSKGQGISEEISWQWVPQDSYYQILRNGVAIASTQGNSYTATSNGRYQVIAKAVPGAQYKDSKASGAVTISTLVK